MSYPAFDLNEFLQKKKREREKKERIKWVDHYYKRLNMLNRMDYRDDDDERSFIISRIEWNFDRIASLTK